MSHFSKLALTGFCITVPWPLYVLLTGPFLKIGLGIWGICGHSLLLYLNIAILLFLGILIGGIACAHIGASRIKKSDGALLGKWLARAAYVVGYLWLAAVIVLIVRSLI